MITEELIKTIYKRSYEYANVRYGSIPDKIELCEDGDIKVIWESYCCGDRDENIEYFSPEVLSEDLDVVAKKREIEEEEKRVREEERQKELKKVRENEEKLRRREQYLKLKKEFDDTL